MVGVGGLVIICGMTAIAGIRRVRVGAVAMAIVAGE
jgi:hypothetical protein